MKEGIKTMKRKILLLLSLCMLFLVSCGKHAAVKDFEDSMKTLQAGEANKNTTSSQLEQYGIDEETLASIREAGKKITYKINSTETKNDEVIINVTMKSPYLTGIQQELIQKLTALSPAELLGKSEDEMKKMGQDIVTNLIKEKLGAEDLQFREETFNVTYTKNGDKWAVDPNLNAEFIDMTTFGLLNMGQ